MALLPSLFFAWRRRIECTQLIWLRTKKARTPSSCLNRGTPIPLPKHKTRSRAPIGRAPVSIVSVIKNLAFSVERVLRERRLFYQVFIFEFVTSLLVASTTLTGEIIEPSPAERQSKKIGSRPPHRDRGEMGTGNGTHAGGNDTARAVTASLQPYDLTFEYFAAERIAPDN